MSLKPRDHTSICEGIQSGLAPSEIKSDSIQVTRVLIDPEPEAEICVLQSSSFVEEFSSYAQCFGEPEDSSCIDGLRDSSIILPGERILGISRARIVGNTSVIDKSNRLYSASFRRDINHPASLYRRTQVKGAEGFVVSCFSGSDYLYYSPPLNSSLVTEPILFLPNLEPNNYGSFLLRQVPALALAVDSGISFQKIVTPSRPSWLLACLSSIGLDTVQVLTTAEAGDSVFESLFMVFPSERSGFIGSTTRSRIRRVFESVLSRPSSRAHSKTNMIYCARTLASKAKPMHRPLLNEHEVISLAEKMGFQILCPETFSWSGQIILFSRSTSIVGPSGSGMLNTLFSPPKARVGDIESFHNTVPQHARLYSSTEKIYSFCFGKTDAESVGLRQGRPWTVDLRDVEELFEWAKDL